MLILSLPRYVNVISVMLLLCYQCRVMLMLSLPCYVNVISFVLC